MEKLIVPGIIVASQQELDERINKVKDYAEVIQLDFMDGNFVPNKSLDFDFQVPQGPIYEAHLMIDNPEQWIEQHGDKVDIILAHLESCSDPQKVIDLAKSKGKKAGFAIKPET